MKTAGCELSCQTFLISQAFFCKSEPLKDFLFKVAAGETESLSTVKCLMETKIRICNKWKDTVKLPKLEITKFNGDPAKLQSFIDRLI